MEEDLNLLEFVLIKKQNNQFTASTTDSYRFRVTPRTGEFIELRDPDEEPKFYKVIAVVHNGEDPEATDLYVELFAADGATFHRKLILSGERSTA